MKFIHKSTAICLSLSFISISAYSTQEINKNIFNIGGNNLTLPESTEYMNVIKSGSAYQLVVDPKSNLIYMSWGYRLGSNPVAGILAFELDSLKAKGFINGVHDVYGLAFDQKNNRLLAEHTVSRKTEEGELLTGNSFDIISLKDGTKLTNTIEIDQGKKERNTFNSHYIFVNDIGDIFISSESKPKNGGAVGMQKITKYDSSGTEIWQTKPFPGLVAALISNDKLIAGVNDLYEINLNDGAINKSLYSSKPDNGEARYMALAKGDDLIYAASFSKVDNIKSNQKNYDNIYVIEKGKAAKGFSTVTYKNNVGVGSTSLSVNPERKELYSANFNDNTISIVDIKNKTNLNKYKNIFIQDAWGINAVTYVNFDNNTYIYATIKGGHGKNVKHTDQGMDDVKLAKITLNKKYINTSSWCKISIMDIKSNTFDYKGRQCTIQQK
ncbi:TPA: beta-propeller fold lactonase family protein [Salmonella enterica subsp. enterica serovar Reading]|nr:beta-propeller fold lactonase family protein [Salmonella enterica]EGB1030519.1 beta-propeller fold lactonase family protein [Salmonella enterica subsp. enterica serovar Reading]EGI5702431.1 beta-propeller fold lactonase family protein [Salmonella enterica subsp. enterica serovar Chester]